MCSVQELVNCWASRASSTQRTGRTGRVRPGVCFRLHPWALKATVRQGGIGAAPEHDVSEIHRRNMEETALQLRSLLSPGLPLLPLARELPEPPDEDALETAVLELVSKGFFASSAPIEAGEGKDKEEEEGNRVAATAADAADHGYYEFDDEQDEYFDLFDRFSDPVCRLTAWGGLAAQLPCDLTCSQLIANGLLLGCGETAAAAAAVLSVGRSVWVGAIPQIHRDADQFNAHATAAFLGMSECDGDPGAVRGDGVVGPREFSFVCSFVRLYVCSFVCLSVCLSVCLFVCLSVYLFVWSSHSSLCC